MIPPPNVTGSLHMGHALTFTIQDTLIRWRRMQGRDALWQPGTDHAGIATQMVVERLLAEQGTTGRRLGREAFVERVWQWKAESGGTITRQLRRLGASLDWPRERFTMDDGLSAAVREVFVTLHRQGLIYRDRRLVNWDPKLQTAISDLEVENREVKGSLWYIRYPDRGRARPVHHRRHHAARDDAGRHRRRRASGRSALPRPGRQARDPAAGRAARIPIVADEYSDPEKGTGAVKITPAHDFNDFEVGQRHDLPMPSILDRQARVALDEIADVLRAVDGMADPAFVRGLAGQDRFAARKAIVAELERLGLLEKIEPHTHQVPHGDRGGVPIEPLLTTQWYCNAADPGEAGDRGGGDRQDRVRAEAMGEHLLRLDARHPALVHLAASSGGAIASRPGTARTAQCSSRTTEAEAAGRGARALRPRRAADRRTRTCWTPGSAPPCGRSPPSAGRSRRRNWRATIPATCW